MNEEVSAQRDLLGTILQANIAVVSVGQAQSAARQNTTMERLTVLATIFLPLTFVTGFFGQNFDWLTGHINGFWHFLILGIGGLLVPLIALALWLRHNRVPEVNPLRGPDRPA